RLEFAHGVVPRGGGHVHGHVREAGAGPHLLHDAEVHLRVAELEPRALGPGTEVGPGEHGEAEDVAVEVDGGVEVIDHHGHMAVAGDGDGRCCGGHGGLHSVVGQRPEAYSSASCAQLSTRRRNASTSAPPSPRAPARMRASTPSRMHASRQNEKATKYGMADTSRPDRAA